MSNVSSSNGIEKYPKLRFKEFSKPWSHVRLADFSERVVRKNKNNETELPLTISSKDGLVDQITFFNKTVASKDMSGYYLLKNGEYAYNKSYSAGYDFGSIKRLERYPMGALSTLYICFALTKYDSDFIKTYFDSLKWYKEIYMISAEGARNHGLLNVPTDEFFETYHYITEDVNEQRKIASLMNLIEQRIQKQQVLVDNLKKYKRGLLKSIFSQEIQFEYQTSWEQRPFSDVAILSKSKYTPKSTETLPCIELEHIEQQTGRIIGNTASNEQNSIKSVFHKGDVLFGKLRPYLKKFALPDFDGVCSSEIWVLHPTKDIDSAFLFYLVQSEGFISAANISSGTKMPRAEWSKVSNENFFVPELKEQKHISQFLLSLDNRIVNTATCLDELYYLKKALLQELFI